MSYSKQDMEVLGKLKVSPPLFEGGVLNSKRHYVILNKSKLISVEIRDSRERYYFIKQKTTYIMGETIWQKKIWQGKNSKTMIFS